MGYNWIFLVLTLAGLGLAVKQTFPTDATAAYVMLAFWIAAFWVAIFPYAKWLWQMPHRRRQVELARHRIANQRPINDSGFRLWLPPQFPSLDFYDRRDALALREIAALWLDQNPEMPLRPEVREKYQFFHDEIYGGRLKAVLNIDEATALALAQIAGYPEDGEDPITVETQVKRDELRRFALKTSDRPMFLFKDRRAGTGTR